MHKFEWVNPYDDQEPRKVTIEVGQDADLTEMLEAFEDYLKAVGYYVDGCVDIVPEHSSDETVREPVFEKGYPSYEAVNSKKKLWDATPQEWTNAYQNVTVKYK